MIINMPVRDVSVLDRGSFFDDSFFRESWDDFDRAMRQVLDRFDSSAGLEVKSKSRPECQDVYRQLRANKIDDDIYTSQALQITERNGNFQVVIDVRDFNPRNLQVKVVDEKVVLEGRYDKVSEDGKSSSSKAFYREFHLPIEADIDKISTALSKDGVLTIRAPRKEGTSVPSLDKNVGNASRVIQNAINDHRLASSRSDNMTRSTQHPHFQNSEYSDSLPKDMKDRLFISDKDSGRSSCSVSPIPSGYSNASSCASPAPSEASSETSRFSSNNEYIKRNNGFQKQEAPFKVETSLNISNPKIKHGYSDNESNNSFDSFAAKILDNSTKGPLARSTAAVGSGGTASISVKEEDGKKTLTSEKSSLVQQKDGFLESKEVSAEVSQKDSQAARREALTRMMKTEEDPEGRFRKSEKADASDVSESCVQHLPDGSVVSVKKNSTSTSNFKQFVSSSGGPGPGFFESEFSSTFRSVSGMPMPSLLNRGSSLRSQMSSDSIGSNMSSFSNFSSSSRFSDMSHFADMSDSFHSSDPFSSRVSNFTNFPAFSSMSDASLFNSDGNQMMPKGHQNSRIKESFSTSSQSSYSSFDNSKK